MWWGEATDEPKRLTLISRIGMEADQSPDFRGLGSCKRNLVKPKARESRASGRERVNGRQILAGVEAQQPPWANVPKNKFLFLSEMAIHGYGRRLAWHSGGSGNIPEPGRMAYHALFPGGTVLFGWTPSLDLPQA